MKMWKGRRSKAIVLIVCVGLIAAMAPMMEHGRAITETDHIDVEMLPEEYGDRQLRYHWMDEHSIYQSWVEYPKSDGSLGFIAEFLPVFYNEVDRTLYFNIHVRASMNPAILRYVPGCVPNKLPWSIRWIEVQLVYDNEDHDQQMHFVHEGLAQDSIFYWYEDVGGGQWTKEEMYPERKTTDYEKWFIQYETASRLKEIMEAPQNALEDFLAVKKSFGSLAEWDFPGSDIFDLIYPTSLFDLPDKEGMFDEDAGWEGADGWDWEMHAYYFHELNNIKKKEGGINHWALAVSDVILPVKADIPDNPGTLSFKIKVDVSFGNYEQCQPHPDIWGSVVLEVNPLVGPSGLWNLPPKAAGIDANPTAPDRDEQVEFNPLVPSDYEGDQIEYRWFFGDGASTSWSATSTTHHSYNTLGEKEIRLEMRDVDGSGTPIHGDFVSEHFDSIEVVNIQPTVPVISSSTHPDEGTWYSDNSPVFGWVESTDASGIDKYFYELDRYSGTQPDHSSSYVDGTVTTKSFSSLDDGEWFFHLRARDNYNVLGPTDHYKVRIDTTGPNSNIYNIFGGFVEGYEVYYDPDKVYTFQILIEANDDGSGLSRAEGSYAFGEEPIDNTPAPNPPQFILQYHYSPPELPHQGEVRIRVFDGSNPPNFEESFVWFIIDDDPPIIHEFGLAPDEGYYAATRDVTLSILAEDATEVDEMRFANDPVEYYSFSKTLESSHPYINDLDQTWSIVRPGATHISVYFETIDLCFGTNPEFDDYLLVYDDFGNEVTYTSYIQNHYTQWFEGDTVHYRLVTDALCTDWGFRITGYNYRTADSWSDWEPYAETKEWQLSDSDGTKTVYLEVRDVFSQVSSDSASIPLDASPPSVPGMPTESSPDLDTLHPQTTYTVHWSPSSDPTGVRFYTLEERQDYGDWEKVSVIIEDTYFETNHGDLIGEAPVFFQYRVKAESFYSGEFSDYSPISDGVLLDPEAPPTPAAPVDEGDYSDIEVIFSWNVPPDDSGIAGYYVCIGTTPLGSEKVLDDFAPAATYTYWASPADEGTTFYAKVKAEDNAGNVGLYSPSSDGVILDATSPTAPSKPYAQNQIYNVFDVVWGASTDPVSGGVSSGLDHYELYEERNAGPWQLVDGAIPSWQTSYHLDVDFSGSYKYKVRSVDGANNWAESPESDIISVWDMENPVFVSMTINEDAPATTSPKVTLFIDAYDPLPTSGMIVKYRNDAEPWTPYEPYVSTRSWFLSAFGGTKCVTVSLKDNDNRPGTPLSEITDCIYVDEAEIVPLPGCPYVSVWNGTDFEDDNSILLMSEDFSRMELDTQDLHLLGIEATTVNDTYVFQIRELGDEVSYLDSFGLIEVERPPDFNMTMTPDGFPIGWRTANPPMSALNQDEEDVLDSLQTMDDDDYFDGERNNYIDLEFGVNQGTPLKLIFNSRLKMPGVDKVYGGGSGGGGMSIRVLKFSETLGWEDLGSVHPRPNWGTNGIDLTANFSVSEQISIRLHWTNHHHLDFIGLDTTSDGVTLGEELQPIAATHSTDGDVLGSLSSVDQSYATITPDEHLTLVFPYSGLPAASRDLILVSHGYYTLGHQPVSGFDDYVEDLNATFIALISSGVQGDHYSVGIANFTWSFGDGTFGQGFWVNHSYGHESVFNVSLLVMWEDGYNETYWREIVIEREGGFRGSGIGGGSLSEGSGGLGKEEGITPRP